MGKLLHLDHWTFGFQFDWHESFSPLWQFVPNRFRPNFQLSVRLVLFSAAKQKINGLTSLRGRFNAGCTQNCCNFEWLFASELMDELLLMTNSLSISGQLNKLINWFIRDRVQPKKYFYSSEKNCLNPFALFIYEKKVQKLFYVIYAVSQCTIVKFFASLIGSTRLKRAKKANKYVELHS